LSDEQHEDAPGVLAAILETAPIFAQVIQKADPVIKSRAFNSSKVSAHHAIIPTEGTADFSKLSEAEQRIYLLIARAYIAQFFPNMKYDETEIYVECEQHKFKTVSNVVTDLGWKKLYKNDADNDDIKENDEAESVDLRQVQNNSFGVCIDASSEKRQLSHNHFIPLLPS
jgi:DNA topoisomerase-3